MKGLDTSNMRIFVDGKEIGFFDTATIEVEFDYEEFKNETYSISGEFEIGELSPDAKRLLGLVKKKSIIDKKEDGYLQGLNKHFKRGRY